MKVGIALQTRPNWIDEFKSACGILDLHPVFIDTQKSNWLQQLAEIDIFVWRVHQGDYQALIDARNKLPFIEKIGISCFPNSRMLWYYDNKIRQSFFFASENIPTPETLITFSKEEAYQYLAKASFPLVAKTYHGASSSGVVLVESRLAGEKIINLAFEYHNPNVLLNTVRKVSKRLGLIRNEVLQPRIDPLRYVYFQEYVRANNDWRITTFGTDIISVFKRINRPNDFRASGSGRWEKVDPGDLPIIACDLALEISNSHGFSAMAYDFLQKEDQWLITEISYTVLLDQIYCNTLFKKTDSRYVPVTPRPIGVMHLDAVISERIMSQTEMV